jgi:hypothetical protein
VNQPVSVDSCTCGAHAVRRQAVRAHCRSRVHVG